MPVKKRDVSQFFNPEVTEQEFEDFGKYLYHPSSREVGKTYKRLKEKEKLE